MVACDPIGVRPLFWQRQGDQIGFASEAKALIGLNDNVWAVLHHFRQWEQIRQLNNFHKEIS